MKKSNSLFTKIVNKKAYFEYEILKDFTAGLILVGPEVKSLRKNNANFTDSYCYVWDNEIFLKSMFIAKYNESSWMNHEERRDRKLLLHKKEIKSIAKLCLDKGITIIPLEIFIVEGRFKIKIGVAKGKKLWNKKEDIKKRDIERELRIS